MYTYICIYIYMMLVWVCETSSTSPNFTEKVNNSNPNPRTPAASRTTHFGLRVEAVKGLGLSNNLFTAWKAVKHESL